MANKIKGLKLPSRFQIGDKSNCMLINAIYEQKVIKVHFSEGKVMYDLDISGYNKGYDYHWTTRIYNVDSAFFPAD